MAALMLLRGDGIAERDADGGWERARFAGRWARRTKMEQRSGRYDVVANRAAENPVLGFRRGVDAGSLVVRGQHEKGSDDAATPHLVASSTRQCSCWHWGRSTGSGSR